MIGIICFTVVALLFAIILVILKNKFENSEDTLNKIVKMLPGYNCGSCGYGSCTGMANAIMKDKNAVNKCKICKNKEAIKNFVDCSKF